MTARVLVVAEPGDAQLVAAPGTFAWGHLEVASTDSGGRTADRFDLVTAFGAAGLPSANASVRWLEHAGAGPRRIEERTIAPAGDGLWSRRLWPVSDELFELAPPPAPLALLVGRPSPLLEQLLERAADRRIAFEVVERLTVGAIARSSCVVLLEAPGSDALPARAAAVLAARRVLLTPRAKVCFGLQPQLDHLQLDEPNQALNFVESVLTRPDAFVRLVHWGGLAAQRHRASGIFGKLLAEVRPDRDAGGR